MSSIPDEKIVVYFFHTKQRWILSVCQKQAQTGGLFLGFPFEDWVCCLLKLSVTPADTLQKTSNTPNYLGERAN